MTPSAGFPGHWRLQHLGHGRQLARCIDDLLLRPAKAVKHVPRTAGKNRVHEGHELSVISPLGLATVLQDLLQADEVELPHPPRCVLPLPEHLCPDHLHRPRLALLDVTQHVTCPREADSLIGVQVHKTVSCAHGKIRFSMVMNTETADKR